MFGTACLFFITFFAATLYAAVVLIQIGGWLSITAGLLLLCSYFITSALCMIGAGIAAGKKKEVKKE